MRLLYLALAGFLGGALAGMGMGGGTLTIPILTVLLTVDQLTAQYANLLAFLPTGAAALAVHKKNGYLDAKPLLFMLPPALAAAALTSLFAPSLDPKLLSKLFGGFLVAAATLSLLSYVLRKTSGKS